jgi:hypothetical protein
MENKRTYISNSLHIEFISELAHKFIELEEAHNVHKSEYIQENEQGTEYTPKGQELFNMYYNDINRRLTNINIYPEYRRI